MENMKSDSEDVLCNSDSIAKLISDITAEITESLPKTNMDIKREGHPMFTSSECVETDQSKFFLEMETKHFEESIWTNFDSNNNNVTWQKPNEFASTVKVEEPIDFDISKLVFPTPNTNSMDTQIREIPTSYSSGTNPTINYSSTVSTTDYTSTKSTTEYCSTNYITDTKPIDSSGAKHIPYAYDAKPISNSCTKHITDSCSTKPASTPKVKKISAPLFRIQAPKPHKVQPKTISKPPSFSSRIGTLKQLNSCLPVPIYKTTPVQIYNPSKPLYTSIKKNTKESFTPSCGSKNSEVVDLSESFETPEPANTEPITNGSSITKETTENNSRVTIKVNTFRSVKRTSNQMLLNDTETGPSTSGINRTNPIDNVKKGRKPGTRKIGSKFVQVLSENCTEVKVEDLKNSSFINEEKLQHYECALCDFSSVEYKQIKIHMLVHNGLNIQQCVFCDYLFKTKGKLKEHILRAHINNSYICSHCSYKASTLKQLNIHQKDHNDDQSDFMHKCKHCPFKSKSAKIVLCHTNFHSAIKQQKCYYCEYVSDFVGLHNHFIHSHPMMDSITIQQTYSHPN